MAQMKCYSTARNAVNEIRLPGGHSRSIVIGNGNLCKSLVNFITGRRRAGKSPCVLAFDGYFGAEWDPVVEKLAAGLKKKGLGSMVFNARDIYKPAAQMESMFAEYTGGDSSFGKVCGEELEDFISRSRAAAIKGKILSAGEEAPEDLAAVICHGPGSACGPLKSVYDGILFLDLSRISIMQKKFSNSLREPHLEKPGGIFWKKEWYVYYHVFDRYRERMLRAMDWYVDGNDTASLKLVPRRAYDAIIERLAKTPLKFRRIMQPGNWGGVHHRKYFSMPELKNCAWDTLFYSPKSSCIVNPGLKRSLEIPFLNIQLAYPEYVCGPYLAKKYPRLLPMIACIDDGYFPEPVHHERSNMPVHLHPDGRYARENFGEQLGRYETYYIVEAYENANTMLGLRENADAALFKEKILAAEKNGAKFDWKEFVKTWPSRKGDLYLIPAGTVHGTGGHQMILELDTCPSDAGTEYSFFIYDYLRNSWDDDRKSFTAEPVRLQAQHGFRQARWSRRERWVERNLLAKPLVTEQGQGWSKDRYQSFGPMPFEIERLHFDKRISHDTCGKFCHLMTLTEGVRVSVRSRMRPGFQTGLERLQMALLPAGFGEYECINEGKTPCTLVYIRWKRG